MSDWEQLSEQLMALDFATGAQVSGVIGVSGEDDTESQLNTLDDAAERVRSAWKRARELDAKAKKRAQELARGALDTAKSLAETAANKAHDLSPPSLAYKLTQRAEEVKEKLKSTAKEVLPWYLGIGVATWVAIGVGAYFLLESNKSQRGERERVVREYARRG